MNKLSIRIIFLVVFMSSCHKEYNQPQWDIAVLGPVFHASMDISDVLADSLQSVGPDGSIHVIYETDLAQLKIDSVFQIPDTSINTIYTWTTFPITITPGQPFYTNNKNLVMNISSGVELKQVLIRSGSIKLSIKNILPSKIIFTYTIPGAVKNGVSFKVVQAVDSGSQTTPVYFNGTFDLSGYSIDLTGLNHITYNTLFYNIAAMADTGGTSFTVSPGDTLINLSTSLTEIVPFYASGYLGQADIEDISEANISLGKLIQGGSIALDSVQMNLDIENGVGAEAQALISYLQSYNANTGVTVNLVAPSVINHYININRASETGNSLNPVNPTHKYLQLDKSNSNIVPFIENLPDKILSKVDLSLNPLGNISGHGDFVYSDYLFTNHLRISLPLRLGVNNLTIADTVDFSFATESDPDAIGKMVFTLIADNGFPFAIDLQLLMIDANHQVRDSLLVPGLIAPAAIGADLKVSNSVRTRIEIPVDESRKQILLQTVQVGIRASFTTIGYPQPLDIYSQYRLDLKLLADGIYLIR